MISHGQMLKPGIWQRLITLTLGKGEHRGRSPITTAYRHQYNSPVPGHEIKDECTDVLVVALGRPSDGTARVCVFSISMIVGHFYYCRRISFTYEQHFEIQLYLIFHHIEECFQCLHPRCRAMCCDVGRFPHLSLP